MKNIYVIASLIFLPFIGVDAQNSAASITMGSSYYPPQNLQDTTGRYLHNQFYAAISVPLIRKFNLSEQGLKFFLLSWGTHGSVDNTNVSFLPLNRTLLNFNSGLNAIYKRGQKGVWFSKFAVSVFEDQTTIHNSTFRVTGFVLHKHSINETFSYLLGGAYNFTFGRGIPLPVLGAGWRFSDRSMLTMVLPFSINYRMGKPSNSFLIFIKPQGGISNVSNNGLYSKAPDKIVFRKREFAIGVKKRVKLNNLCSLFAEGGLLVRRKIYLSENISREAGSTLFESNVKSGIYISAGVQLRFNHKDESDIQKEIIDADYLSF